MAESNTRFKIRAYLRLAELCEGEERQAYIESAEYLLDNLDGNDAWNDKDAPENRIAWFVEEYEKQIIDRPTEEVYQDFCRWYRQNCGTYPPKKKTFSRRIANICNIGTRAIYSSDKGKNIRIYTLKEE